MKSVSVMQSCLHCVSDEGLIILLLLSYNTWSRYPVNSSLYWLQVAETYKLGPSITKPTKSHVHPAGIDQPAQPHKPACAAAQTDQSLCLALFG